MWCDMKIEIWVSSANVVIEAVKRQDCMQNGKRKGQRLDLRTRVFGGPT